MTPEGRIKGKNIAQIITSGPSLPKSWVTFQVACRLIIATTSVTDQLPQHNQMFW